MLDWVPRTWADASDPGLTLVRTEEGCCMTWQEQRPTSPKARFLLARPEVCWPLALVAGAAPWLSVALKMLWPELFW